MKVFTRIIRVAIFPIIFLSLFVEGHSQKVIKIMPLGNSITEGWTVDTVPPERRISYRYALKYLLEGAGYKIDFVGSEDYGCQYFSDCQCAGIDGTRDEYLARLLTDGYDPRWNRQIINPPGPYLDVYNPDIILLHIGTNDITHEADAYSDQQVSAILDKIDEYEQRANKQVTVFLALIINRRLGEPKRTETSVFNDSIKAMAERRIQQGDKIVIVDMEHDAGFKYTNEDITAADPQGLHPNANGYLKMAQLWFSSIVNYYNSTPVITNIPNQTIAEGDRFDTIPLDNYISDVEDPDSLIQWTVTHLYTSNLNVEINQKRQAIVSPVDSNWNGTESIIFTATDNGVNGTLKKSVSDTVTFTITPVNDPPVITGQSTLSIQEDTKIQLTLSDFTVFDPDNTPSVLSLSIFSGNHYTVSGDTIIPDANYDSTLYVNVAVSDSIAQGPVYSASISVIPVDDPPVYLGQSPIEINEDATYTLNLQDLNFYDVDNPDSELTVVMKSGNDYSIVGNQIIPKKDFFGQLNIESYISDPQGQRSATFILVIDIQPVNDPPVFTSSPDTVAYMDTLYYYAISATDVDDQQLNYSIIEKPDWLNSYSNATVLAGVPSNKDIGTNHVDIRVSDGKIDVDQSFDIQVIGQNNPPVITGLVHPITTLENHPIKLTVSDLIISDPDNTYPTDFILIVESGTNYTFDGDTISPFTNYTGVLNVPVKVSDGVDTSPVFNVVIQVDLESTLVEDQSSKGIPYIFPNPAYNKVTIICEDTSDKIVFKLFNIAGKMILEKDNIHNNSTIEMEKSNLSPGLYIYKILTGHHSYIGKLIIQSP